MSHDLGFPCGKVREFHRHVELYFLCGRECFQKVLDATLGVVEKGGMSHALTVMEPFLDIWTSRYGLRERLPGGVLFEQLKGERLGEEPSNRGKMTGMKKWTSFPCHFELFRLLDSQEFEEDKHIFLVYFQKQK